jgi:hypothetical protein
MRTGTNQSTRPTVTAFSSLAVQAGVSALLVLLLQACGAGGGGGPGADSEGAELDAPDEASGGGELDVLPDAAEDTVAAPDAEFDANDTDGLGPDVPMPECSVPADCSALVPLAGACEVVVCLEGTCDIASREDGAACDDGDPCTLSDACTLGACAGKLLACNDNNPCTDETCSNGACATAFNSAPCDDGNDCTSQDTCALGTCKGGENDCPCDFSDDCVKFDDGDLCTGALECVGGFCEVDPASVPECLSSDACQVPTCVPETGECSVVMVPDGAPCSDGDPCTTQESCSSGVCTAGSTVPCDDKNPCTTDNCLPAGGCDHAPLSGPICDDGDPCTQDGACVQGACVGAIPWNCDDGNPCTIDTCQPGGGCTYTFTLGPCEDGNLCTTGETCADATCGGGSPIDCNDGEICTQDACAPALGCIYEAKVDGAGCTDGDPCTLGDACADGVCVPSQTLDCDDGNACTTDLCLVGGACESLALPDLTPCDDGDACTANDVCTNGVCTPGALLCDPCETNGNWAPCDDGVPTTVGDFCWQTECQGFVRQVFNPTASYVSGGFTAVALDKTNVVAVGYSTEAGGAELTWGCELRGNLAPSLYATSLRTDTRFRAMSHGMALGNNGVASLYNGAIWDKAVGFATAYSTLAQPESVNAVWGANLANVPGNQRDVWLLGGRTKAGGAWIARCNRESAPGGGFLWFCAEEGGISALVGGVAGLAGWTAPCTSVGCTGLEIAGARAAAEAASGDASYILERKIGSWTAISDVVGLPGDRWTALRGGQAAMWGSGTRGLMATAVTAGALSWGTVGVGGGPPLAQTDFIDLFVTPETVLGVARRVYQAFGKQTVDTYLAAWSAGATTGGAGKWLKLATNFCPGAECTAAADPAQRLSSVVVGGIGTFKGVYAVGAELVGGVERPVVYFRPLP